MRPARTALVTTAAAVAAASVVAATAPGARADLLPTPTLTPLPTVSVPTLPLPTVSVPLPSPSPSLAGSTPTASGSGTSGSGSGSGDTSPGSAPSTSTASSGTATGPAGAAGPTTTAERRQAARRQADATPMVAGTPAAAELVDDESSPALRRASQQFLAADLAIAGIDRQKQLLARLRQDAAETSQLYRAMGYDVAGAARVATGWHARLDGLAPATSAPTQRLVQDTATRADERHGALVVGQQEVRAELERIALRYHVAKQALADANSRLTALAGQRSMALQAVRAARSSDVALNQARLAESGRLGAEIDALSQRLARQGDTVPGTGDFARPLDGTITSPFGIRYHPILHYTKLHTGTDFAGGSVIRAADDGRVLMTVLSTAYGNFTVIDHGTVDGNRVTTAYAHQARFLVRPGQRVSKGDPIGIVGATGYATGPHLHFEVRENGTVVDPMRYLR
jgi:murein DD-endopeptidase MepM/ murein hydrolase activator NlpD